MIVYLVLLILCVEKINLMAINGPVLTRYDPCGLAVIHFDKISDRYWQGVINLSLYPNLKRNVNIVLNFDKKVKIQGSPRAIEQYWREYVFKLKGATPPTYVFYVRIQDDDTDVPTVAKFAINDLVLCDERIKLSHTLESLSLTSDEGQPFTHVCGRRALDHAELTSVRTDAEAGDWPWHVALLIADVDTGELTYECGGNIVSRTAVVTAGHCVSKDEKPFDPSRVIILAGVNNHKDAKQVGRQKFIAEKVILHPNYDDDHATADLAVIKIGGESGGGGRGMRFTEYVQPICLWGPVYDKTNLFGYPATVVGFGTREDGQPSDVLRSTNILVQNDSTCIAYSPRLYKSLLNEFTFCAGFGPKIAINARNGDSGGGLVVPTMQQDHRISWFLRGVLSKCGVPVDATACDPRFYTVYTDIGPHYGWIIHHSGLKYTNNIV